MAASCPPPSERRNNMTSPTTAPRPPEREAAKHCFTAGEVAWLFVKQYYTTLNGNPDALHLLYTNESTMLHGIEGQTAEQYNGQEEIHKKITEMGYEDCRVWVTNVDSLPSLEGGIFIQVIGEMSNRGERSRKFAQSFFLAEQVNGYYLLNDVFRYLKEAVDEEYEDVVEEEVEEANGYQESRTLENGVDSTPIPVMSQPEHFDAGTSNSAVEERARTPSPTEDKEPFVAQHVETEPELRNPKSSESASLPKEPGDDSEATFEDAASAEPHTDIDEAESTNLSQVSTRHSADTGEPSMAPDEAASASAPGEDTQRANPAPQEREYSQISPPSATPSTYASVVTHEASKWKKETLADVKGTSVRPAAAPTPSAPHAFHAHSGHANSYQPGMSQNNLVSHGFRDSKDKYRHEPSASIYVRNVTIEVSSEMLCSAFSTFGEVMNCDFNMARTAAFVDFASVESAIRAVKQKVITLPNDVVVIAEEKRAKQTRQPGGRGNYSGTRGGYPASSRADSVAAIGDSARGGRGRGRGRGVDSAAKPGRSAPTPAGSGK